VCVCVCVCVCVVLRVCCALCVYVRVCPPTQRHQVKRLVEAGPDVLHEENEYGGTALMGAANNGHVAVARFLLDHVRVRAYVCACVRVGRCMCAQGASPCQLVSVWVRVGRCVG
jgi:hypothetical protein